jgi:hypothetical protein
MWRPSPGFSQIEGAEPDANAYPGRVSNDPAKPSELRSVTVKSPLVVMKASASAVRSTSSNRYRRERPLEAMPIFRMNASK